MSRAEVKKDLIHEGTITNEAFTAVKVQVCQIHSDKATDGRGIYLKYDDVICV